MELELCIARLALFILCTYDEKAVLFFLVKYLVLLIFSITMVIQYIKYLPYYDDSISILNGFLSFFLLWIMINSLLTYILPITGHFIVLGIGIIPIYLLVVNVRSKLIDQLLMTAPDKITTELEAIIQCYAIFALTSKKLSPEEDIKLVGLVNVHVKDSEVKTKGSAVDSLSKPGELYDPVLNKHVEDGNMEQLHKNPVFLKHFGKQ